jgi:hypothetical protein
MARIPPDFEDLIVANAFAHLGVALADGSLTVYPIRCDDGATINFRSSKADHRARHGLTRLYGYRDHRDDSRLVAKSGSPGATRRPAPVL